MSKYGHISMSAVPTIGKAKRATERKQKVKKPNFIKRWITSVVQQTLNYNTNDTEPTSIGRVVPDEGLDSNTPFNFRVHHANGGRIVQINHYDHIKDRTSQKLYIITDDKSFGEEIDKIMTIEGLRR